MVACENKLPSFIFDFMDDWRINMNSIDSSGDTGDIAGMTIKGLIGCITFGGVNRVPS